MTCLLTQCQSQQLQTKGEPWEIDFKKKKRRQEQRENKKILQKKVYQKQEKKSNAKKKSIKSTNRIGINLTAQSEKTKVRIFRMFKEMKEKITFIKKEKIIELKQTVETWIENY